MQQRYTADRVTLYRSGNQRRLNAMPRGAGRGKLPRTAQSLPRGTAQGCCVKRDEGSLFLIAISPPQRPLPRGAASHPYRQRVALSVRVERRGKSSPARRRLRGCVNPIRSNTAEERIAPARRVPRRWRRAVMATSGQDRWLFTTELGL